MNFVSMDEFYKDISAWERKLPHFDAVIGIPRSGMIPAAYLAVRRNIRLIELNDLLSEPAGAIERAPIRNTNPIIKYNKPCGNRVLIVDDSSSDESVTISALRQQLSEQTALDISYGVVYRASETSKVDYFYREVPLPRMFGWNWYRHWWLQHAMCDMDGVLCEDWPGTPEVSGDDARTLDHLVNVKPLYIPDVPIRAIVTSRLEKYRPQTKAWLKEHGVRYGNLIMHPATSPEDRRFMRDHAERKASAYAGAPTSVLFVESDITQATTIHTLTKRPVLCTDTMTMLRKVTHG